MTLLSDSRGKFAINANFLNFFNLTSHEFCLLIALDFIIIFLMKGFKYLSAKSGPHCVLF